MPHRRGLGQREREDVAGGTVPFAYRRRAQGRSSTQTVGSERAAGVEPATGGIACGEGISLVTAGANAGAVESGWVASSSARV